MANNIANWLVGVVVGAVVGVLIAVMTESSRGAIEGGWEGILAFAFSVRVALAASGALIAMVLLRRFEHPRPWLAGAATGLLLGVAMLAWSSVLPREWITGFVAPSAPEAATALVGGMAIGLAAWTATRPQWRNT